MNGQLDPIEPGTPRKYRWPWVVLALVIVGIGLAILWMSKEVERAKRIHDANMPGRP
jgi:hypothetical protein